MTNGDTVWYFCTDKMDNTFSGFKLATPSTCSKHIAIALPSRLEERKLETVSL